MVEVPKFEVIWEQSGNTSR